MTVLVTQASYSWWVYPANVYKYGANYFTYVKADGSLWIERKYKDTDPLKLRVGWEITDEHNRPSFLFFDDYILVFLHPRNSASYFCRKINYDLTFRGEQVNIGSQASMGDCNYSQPIHHEGRIFVTFRSDYNSWGITWSDDYGITWVSQKKWIHWTGAQADNKMYTLSQYRDGKIVIGAYYHPVDSGELNKFFLLELDPSTGDYTEAGLNKGNLFDAGFTTIETSNLTPRYSLQTGRNFRFYDLSLSEDGTIINVFISDFSNDYSNGTYILKRYNRSTLAELESINITDTGYDTYTTYFGGIYFVTDEEANWSGNFYLSRNESDIWYVEKWQYLEGAVSKIEDIENLAAGANGLSLNRPEPPKNSMDGGVELLYQKGDYNESFTDLDEVNIISIP